MLTTTRLGSGVLYTRTYKAKPIRATRPVRQGKTTSSAPRSNTPNKPTDILPQGGWIRDPRLSWAGPDYIPL